MSLIQDGKISRRGVLKAGGVLMVLSASVPAALRLAATNAMAAGAPYPELDPTQLASWLAVKADNTVVAYCGHVDLGQGNRTALSQIVAEELDVAFGQLEMILGNTNETPNQGVTAGSTTILVAGSQLRLIAAEGRATLLSLASTHLGVPASALKVKDGVVSHGSKKVTYGQLVQGKTLTAVSPISIEGYGGFQMQVKVGAKPKSPSQYTLVGKSIPRVDIPPKVTGAATFVQDVRVPGMVHARVIHPAGIGSTVVSVGTLPSSAAATIYRKGNLVAVVAEREWDAIKAAETLQVTWSKWSGLPESSDLATALPALSGPVATITNRGDFTSALTGAATTLKGTYLTPFENHGMMGPSCAVADVSPGNAVLYSSTQYPQGLQAGMAEILGLSPEQVEVRWFEGPGCYGRLSANYDDAASEAAIISQGIGKPVRVQWMRADEHVWEPHGPGTLHSMEAGLDSSGKIVAWKHEAWMPPNNDSTSLGASLAGVAMTGGRAAIGGWTGQDLYTFPASLELAHELPELGASSSPYNFGLRTTFLRSPGQYQITYAQEAFVDEVAAKAGVDALQFRLAHLTDPRAIAVLKGAAKAGGWESRPSPRKGSSAHEGKVTGQGIALVLRGGTYAAAALKATIDTSTGAIAVSKVAVAQDSGLIINPEAIKHQIESCVIQTMSRSMLEEVTFNSSNVTSTDWSSYPILNMSQAPQEISYVLINHPEIPATGVGEPAVNLIPSMLSSAVFDGTGVRIRALPLRSATVKKALRAN